MYNLLYNFIRNHLKYYILGFDKYLINGSHDYYIIFSLEIDRYV